MPGSAHSLRECCFFILHCRSDSRSWEKEVCAPQQLLGQTRSSSSTCPAAPIPCVSVALLSYIADQTAEAGKRRCARRSSFSVRLALVHPHARQRPFLA